MCEQKALNDNNVEASGAKAKHVFATGDLREGERLRRRIVIDGQEQACRSSLFSSFDSSVFQCFRVSAGWVSYNGGQISA
jgi:hypothetical protein